MKVFISWSKEPSKAVAQSLRVWIPNVLQAVEPWMSEEDIAGGARWGESIAGELASSNFGIICVTNVNQHAPWLMFEAGALAKTLDDTTRVFPYLIDIANHNITGPLTQFQSQTSNKIGTFKLIQSLNAVLKLQGERFLETHKLDETFEVWWPKLENNFNKLPKPEGSKGVTKRTVEDMVTEVLEVVRDLRRESIEIGANTQTGKSSKLMNKHYIGRNLWLDKVAKLPTGDIKKLLSMINLDEAWEVGDMATSRKSLEEMFSSFLQDYAHRHNLPFSEVKMREATIILANHYGKYA